jgi:hypothetical protein
MKTIKVMGIIGIVLASITTLVLFGGGDEMAIGLWALASLAFLMAQSIVAVVKIKE